MVVRLGWRRSDSGIRGAAQKQTVQSLWMMLGVTAQRQIETVAILCCKQLALPNREAHAGSAPTPKAGLIASYPLSALTSPAGERKFARTFDSENEEKQRLNE